MIAQRILFNKIAFRSSYAFNFRKRLIGCFSTSSQSLISNISQVKEANRYYEQKDMAQAAQYFESSINILPFYQQGSNEYNQQFEDIAQKLAICYAWKGETHKLCKLTQKILRQSKKLQIQLGNKIIQVIDTLSIINKNQNVLKNDIKKQIKDNYIKIGFSQQRSKQLLTKQLTKLHKNQQPNSINLQNYLYGQLRSSIAFIFTSLLLYPNFTSNPQYNKLCKTLLKTAQKSSQKNIIKPLSILITNLLRNNQYLQAEGMIKYCLDRKRQNIKLNLLKSNQQYILLNLLLASTYEGVDRLNQSKQIILEYETYMLQHFLIDSF